MIVEQLATDLVMWEKILTKPSEQPGVIYTDDCRAASSGSSHVGKDPYQTFWTARCESTLMIGEQLATDLVMWEKILSDG